VVQVGAFDAKTHLPSLLERVAHGEIVQITRRGVPVAQLVPIPAKRSATPAEAVRHIREKRRGLRLGGLKIKELINEGRR